MNIREANLNDLDIVIPLFHEYRSFYRHPKEKEAETYIKERLEKKDSTIFLAISENKIAGFMQLYPTFTSRGLGRVWILNDLFVYPEFRRQNLGHQLLSKAVKFGIETNAKFISLSTEISNSNAQNLYKKFGFKKDNDFFNYTYKL